MYGSKKGLTTYTTLKTTDVDSLVDGMGQVLTRMSPDQLPKVDK